MTAIFEYKYFTALMIAWALVVWFWGNAHGLGLTADSYYYLSATQDQDYLHPQLCYSFLISLIPIKATSSAWCINFICYFITLIIWRKIILISDLGSTYKLFAMGWVCFGTPLFLIASFLWTEMLFVLMFSCVFLSLTSFSGRYVGFVLSIIFVLAMWWTRKVGILFLPPLLLVFVFQFIRRLSMRLLSVLLTILGMLTVWKYFFSGEEIFFETVFFNLSNNTLALAHWVVPYITPDSLSLILGGFLMMTLIFLIRKQSSVDLFLACAFVIYFIIRLFAERPYPEESDRYFAIFYAPAGLAFMRAVSSMAIPRRKIMIGLSILLAIMLIRNARQSLIWNEHRAYEIPEKVSIKSMIIE